MVVAGFITLLVVALVFLLFREALFRSGNILAPPTAGTDEQPSLQHAFLSRVWNRL